MLELDTAAMEAELADTFPMGPLRSKQGRPLSDDELKALADFCKRVVAKGQLPTRLVAGNFGVDPAPCGSGGSGARKRATSRRTS